MPCGGYFYGSVDCFRRRQPLHDSIMSVTGVIAGSWTEHALADNSERMSCKKKSKRNCLTQFTNFGGGSLRLLGGKFPLYVPRINTDYKVFQFKRSTSGSALVRPPHPTYLSADLYKFYRDFSSIYFIYLPIYLFSPSILRARWTKLNQNRPSCSKVRLSAIWKRVSENWDDRYDPSPTNREPDNHLFWRLRNLMAP